MSRFVFLSSNYGWGGSEELWAEAAALLAESGHSVTVFTAGVEADHPRICRLRELGCHLRDLHKGGLPSRFPLPLPVLRLARLLVRVKGKTSAQRAIRPFLRTHLSSLNPDLVVISQGSNFDGLAYSDLCRISGRPYVVISQKATDYLWPLGKDRMAMRSAFQSALRCYFVSQHNLQLTEYQIGETLRNAEIVRNPFLVAGNHLPWPDSQDRSIKLACVARLDIGDKGQDILLQVLARPRWRNRNVSVSFFGAGHHEAALRELTDRLALANVAFPGFVTDVDSIWKTHHALVLPSRTEGLPLALVEAMMCGRFGIVTNEGGTCEVVEDGRTGFIANSAKVDDFDHAMDRAWSVREEWESIGKAAGVAVRTMVPVDPAASFASRLLGLVESPSRKNSYAYPQKSSQ
jgi:glycosyltransferase involved in cell wall biosynthesis